MTKITKVCDQCGSEDVFFETIAIWNYRRQNWQIGEDLHKPHCGDCHREITVVDKEDTEEPWESKTDYCDRMGFDM